MNKSDLVEALSEGEDLTKTKAEEIVNLLFDPDGHFKIPHLWPLQNPPPLWWWPLEYPHRGKGRLSATERV